MHSTVAFSVFTRPTFVVGLNMLFLNYVLFSRVAVRLKIFIAINRAIKIFNCERLIDLQPYF